MPFGRRRPLMRAAIVGGAAYHAGKRVQEGREADYDRDARIAELEQQQAVQTAPMAAPAPAASGITDDTIAQIQKLGQLKEQGLLTDDEFEAQKRKLLGSL
jgi:putative oligomerization/nucleic acid binding protein